MRFMTVRLSCAGEGEFCAFCGTSIGQQYVRDLETRQIFHSLYCMDMTVESSQKLIEYAARSVS